jgi:hypothetical protein
MSSEVPARIGEAFPITRPRGPGTGLTPPRAS